MTHDEEKALRDQNARKGLEYLLGDAANGVEVRALFPTQKQEDDFRRNFAEEVGPALRKLTEARAASEEASRQHFIGATVSTLA